MFLSKQKSRKDAHSMVLVTFWQIKAFGAGDTGGGSVKAGGGRGSDSSVLM